MRRANIPEMNSGKAGIILVIAALSLWLVEKPAQIISASIGKIRCGDQYMQAVDGVVGEQSCGFNDDMYVASLLLIMLLSGFILHITRNSN